MKWRLIETAPRDGTEIIGYNDEYGLRETRRGLYREGSLGYAKYKAGEGPLDYGWDWDEPKHGSAHTWHPTHWTPMVVLPGREPDEIITQDDRDAAENLLMELEPDRTQDPDDDLYGIRHRIGMGYEDNHILVQAFAAYRRKLNELT